MPGGGSIDEVVLPQGLRVEAKLGSGKFGVVYRAYQSVAKRRVAVKVLARDYLFAPGAVRLFLDEIAAVAQVDHPNVVSLYHAEETAGGDLYFVMALLEGLTLEQIASQGRVPVARAVGWLTQLLDGLAAVHATGHIHADVKPSNAILAGDRVVLIDFGLARLRAHDALTEAVGGTHAYMAPEQLSDWKLDPRSDVFSAALVFVRLVTGWERGSATEVVPPLDKVTDPGVRAALQRALAIDPADRPSAAELARILRGEPADSSSADAKAPPFRELAPLTERDRWRLYGRDADVMRLARRIDTGRAIVLTAPSGTGKTSLLRAGLAPYLAVKGTACEYIACEPGAGALVAAALARAADAPGRRLVIILDQFESLLVCGDEGERVLGALLDAPRDGVAVVIGVREDFVARLFAVPALVDGAPQVRIGPLDRAGARDAIVVPLEEHGIAIEPELLVSLLNDLEDAADALGADLGWEAAVFPPHLQLVGSTLFDALGPQDTVLTLARYRELGGFSSIVAEHLQRALGELSEGDREIARDVFLSMVASSQTRAIRSEADLLEELGAKYGEARSRAVLARLESQRLLARRLSPDGTPTWSLVHDTLVPKIAEWLSVHDLERRTVAEVLRFHLRQSQRGTPALLDRKRLRQIDAVHGLVEELEMEWSRRSGIAWTPKQLVARSRTIARYRMATFWGLAVAVIMITTALIAMNVLQRIDSREKLRVSDLNVGGFEIEISMVDWERDPETHELQTPQVDASELPDLSWTFHDPDIEDPTSPGERVAPDRFRVEPERVGPTYIQRGKMRGGSAYIEVHHRHRGGRPDCPPSIIPIHPPGHREPLYRISLVIPTCDATRFDTRRISDGVYLSGGHGDPRSAKDPPLVRLELVPPYRIDRHEIANDEYDKFGALAPYTSIWPVAYPQALKEAHFADPLMPRGNIDWTAARAYCRYLGKELPTFAQWQMALRGGVFIDGKANRYPARNVPWEPPSIADAHVRARVPTSSTPDDEHKPATIFEYPDDRSPYGVYGLAGNVQEWTDTIDDAADEKTPIYQRPRVALGGNFDAPPADQLATMTATKNPRAPGKLDTFLGARCALSGE